MHEVLVNRLGGLSLPRKSVVRLTDRPDMTLDVFRGRKTAMQHLHIISPFTTYVIISEHYVFAKTHHFVWSNFRNPIVNLEVFKSLQKANRCKSVRNRTILHVPHKRHLPIFFLILQTLRPNAFHLMLWHIWIRCSRWLRHFRAPLFKGSLA